MSSITVRTQSPLQYRTGTGIDTFKNYFISRFHQISKILNQRFNLMKIKAITLKELKQSKEDTNYTVARVYEISQTEKYMTFLLDDITGYLECRYYKKADHDLKIITDIILGFKIYKSKTISQIIFPDITLSDLKISDSLEKKYVVLISDIHVGSKQFAQQKFIDFIQYINKIPEVKYAVLGGDVVEGIGIYPNQQKDLAIFDIDQQYKKLAEMLKHVRKDIHLIISPGNHDYLPVQQPQEKLDLRFRKLFENERTTFIPNPCLFDIQGVSYLMYHGRGMDSLLASGKFSTHGQKVQELSEFLLKVRHLSPSYDAKNTNFILNKDLLVVNKKPDLLHLGHIHRCFIKNYKGTLICNAGTWQGQTDFQKRMDLFPDTGCFILVNLNNLKQATLKYV